MRESFARVIPPQPVGPPPTDPPPEKPKLPKAANDNEVLPSKHIFHPEAANDNESSQPISTIYPEAANDNLVASKQEELDLELTRENLKLHAKEWSKDDAVTEATPEVPPINPEGEGTQERSAEAAPAKPETSTSEVPPPTSQNSGGARKGGEGGSGGAGVGSTEGNSPRKKGFLGKSLSFMWKITKGALKTAWLGLLLLGGAFVTGSILAVKKTTETAFDRAGLKGGGGGAKAAPKKPAGGGGGGGHH